MVQVLEAPSIKREGISKDAILRMIPQYEISPVFLRQHLDREVVIGAIGDRGGGKSGSDAVVSIVDFMLAGKRVWANLPISANIKIEDSTARKYGLNSGGIAHYESFPLDKDALLKLDDNYRDGCIVIEEINVQYSNVRRFMSNTNVEFNEVCQQLRKFKVSLLYNVVDEMFIDPQLRSLTDIFFRTYDTAFDLDSLEHKKQPGLDFCWQVYPMTGYLRGEQGRYSLTKRSEKVYFHFGPWRGTYDSTKHQEQGRYSLNKRERQKEEALKASYSVGEDKELDKEMNKWQWLIDKARELKHSGQTEIHARPLWAFLDIASRGLTPYYMGKILPAFGISHARWDNREKDHIYKIDTYDIDEIIK